MRGKVVCSVSPGAFSTEFAIMVHGIYGATSLFADTRDVEVAVVPGKGFLQVDVLDICGYVALIRLPAEAFHGSRYLSVPLDSVTLLEPAGGQQSCDSSPASVRV